MNKISVALSISSLCLLSACSGTSGSLQRSLPEAPQRNLDVVPRAALTQLVNLDYSHGVITIFAIHNGQAAAVKRFRPGRGIAQGLAVDGQGNIYTTITPSDSKPCVACVEIFAPDGTLTGRLPAPILQGAPGAPSMTDVSVDSHRNVYVSDYGQQAVYFFQHARATRHPTIVVANSQNAASVLAAPNGANVLVSGGCGFASVRPYARVAPKQYTPGACFGIGTIALIGAATDNALDTMTPVDGVPGLVSVSSPNGGTVFQTPDQRHASISGAAFNADASIAYVANHDRECVYAFARPAGGWLSNVQPQLLATYKGFKHLDIIAVPR